LTFTGKDHSSRSGALSGTLLALLHDAYQHAAYWAGITRSWLTGYMDPANPSYAEPYALNGVRYAAAEVFYSSSSSIAVSFWIMMVLLVLRILLRRAWLAYLVWAIMFVVVATQSGPPQLIFPMAVLIIALALIVLLRFGVLGLITTIFVSRVIGTVPLATDFSAWYVGNMLPALVAVLGLSIYGFYTSLGGQPLIRTDLLDAN